MEISVILCSYNPRPEYIKRTLESLKNQTLSKDRWDLLIVDNNSNPPIQELVDISWHPKGRIVIEDRQGLTNARIRGIVETKGDLLLFVDDDNVLKEDYIEHALIKMQNMAWLGAIGGAILPEYEATPPSWFLPYERMLAIRRPTVAKWSNSLTDWESQPWGAGLVMRRKVCEQYLEDVENDVLKKGLGRSGDSLMSGEDVDMVFSCTKLGLGFGVFPDLVVLHLIPKNRLNENYLLQLSKNLKLSNYILKTLWGIPVEPTMPVSVISLLRMIYRHLRRSRIQRKMDKIQKLAALEFAEWMSDNS